MIQQIRKNDNFRVFPNSKRFSTATIRLIRYNRQSTMTYTGGYQAITESRRDVRRDSFLERDLLFVVNCTCISNVSFGYGKGKDGLKRGRGFLRY